MPREAAEELVEFLENQAGDYFRGAMQYTTHEYRVLYLREDVDALYEDATLETLSAYYRRRRDEQGGEPFSLGNRHCTVQFYDDAILFHFAQGEDVGTVVTLDPEAGRDIVTFITRCLGFLHHHSSQTIENAPIWLRE